LRVVMADVPPPPAAIGHFHVAVSRRTGAKYYFSSASSESFWHDDALPAGWAWGRRSETCPKFYVNLFTAERQLELPVSPAVPGAIAGRVTGMKRSREEYVNAKGINTHDSANGEGPQSSHMGHHASKRQALGDGVSGHTGSGAGPVPQGGAESAAPSAAGAAAQARAILQTQPPIPFDDGVPDHPLLALIRQEWLCWHLRRFSLHVVDLLPRLLGRQSTGAAAPADTSEGRLTAGVPMRMSKSLASMVDDGLPYGLQGMHYRWLMSQSRLQPTAVDPLIPYAPEVLDKDMVKEWKAMGMDEDAATGVARGVTDDGCRAAVACARARVDLQSACATRIVLVQALPHAAAVEPAGGSARSTSWFVVYLPSPAEVRTWLQPVRGMDPLPTTLARETTGAGAPASSSATKTGNGPDLASPPSWFRQGAAAAPLFDRAREPRVAASLEAAGIQAGAGPFLSALEISDAHLRKLRLMYRCASTGITVPATLAPESANPLTWDAEPAARGSGGAASSSVLSHSAGWLRSLYCMLARYETVVGPASGYQGALTHSSFDALERYLAVRGECFASPLNAHFPTFFSAYRDTDSPFGSRGSFFEHPPADGAWEANPPFVNDTMLAMARTLDSALCAAEAAGRPLLFAVVVPAWDDAYYMRLLSESTYCRAQARLERKRHEYIQGLQYRAGSSVWKANVDSRAFVLATSAGAVKWAAGPGCLQPVLAAFAAPVAADARESARVFKYTGSV
jgi:hypothetical protein